MASITFERYGIYRADLNPTRGSGINKVRPVVIVSLNVLNETFETVVVCPLTTKLHPRWRSRLQMKCQGKSAEIAVDQIRTVSKSRLISKLGALSTKEAKELRRLISEMYGQPLNEPEGRIARGQQLLGCDEDRVGLVDPIEILARRVGPLLDV